MKIVISLLCVFLLLSCSTKDDAGCFVSNVDFTNLEAAYNCENTKFAIDIELENTFTIIQNQTEYETRVSGDCNVAIDFETYSLIIGKQALTNGNTFISYEYTLDCAINTYALVVTFNQNETEIAPNLTYHILSPKISDDAIVTVQTVINQ